MVPFLQDLFRNQQYERDTFFLMAGPCVVESEALVLEVAEKVSGICKKLGIPLIFKSSYKKANRTSAASFTGLGDETGLEIIRTAGGNIWLANGYGHSLGAGSPNCIPVCRCTADSGVPVPPDRIAAGGRGKRAKSSM
jgi:hypothetical protein